MHPPLFQQHVSPARIARHRILPCLYAVRVEIIPVRRDDLLPCAVLPDRAAPDVFRPLPLGADQVAGRGKARPQRPVVLPGLLCHVGGQVPESPVHVCPFTDNAPEAHLLLPDFGEDTLDIDSGLISDEEMCVPASPRSLLDVPDPPRIRACLLEATLYHAHEPCEVPLRLIHVFRPFLLPVCERHIEISLIEVVQHEASCPADLLTLVRLLHLLRCGLPPLLPRHPCRAAPAHVVLADLDPVLQLIPVPYISHGLLPVKNALTLIG